MRYLLILSTILFASCKPAEPSQDTIDIVRYDQSEPDVPEPSADDPHAMQCAPLYSNSIDNSYERCENDEVICYADAGGLQCRFKEVR